MRNDAKSRWRKSGKVAKISTVEVEMENVNFIESERLLGNARLNPSPFALNKRELLLGKRGVEN